MVPPVPGAGVRYSRWGVVVAPREDKIPGKTGDYDPSIVIDTELEVGGVLHLLVAGRGPDECLFRTSGEENIDSFNHVVELLGLQPLRPCRYALRHGGASEDLLSSHRTLEMIKKRGGWRSDQSMARYGKETRLMAEIRKNPQSTHTYGRHVPGILKAVLIGRVAPGAPPSAPLTDENMTKPKRARRASSRAQ